MFTVVCSCGCGRLRAPWRWRFNDLLSGATEELSFWRQVFHACGELDAPAPVDNGFFHDGELLRAQMIEILHGERARRGFDRDAWRDWLARSAQASADLDPQVKAQVPLEEAAYFWSREELLTDTIRGRLALALEDRLGTDRLPPGDPDYVPAAAIAGGGAFLYARLCLDEELMPLAKPRGRRRARRELLAAYTRERLFPVAAFLAAAVLRYTAWTLRLAESETARRSWSSWQRPSERLAELLGEEGRRLEQCEAVYRLLQGEEWSPPEVPGYPAPMKPILSVEVREAEPGTPEHDEVLEGSRFAAGGFFLLHAHRHALHLALGRKRFERLFARGGTIPIQTLAPLEWHLASRELWTQAARECKLLVRAGAR